MSKKIGMIAHIDNGKAPLTAAVAHLLGNKAEEGRDAYKNGMPREANPYPYGTARYWQWSSGWCDERAFRPLLAETRP